MKKLPIEIELIEGLKFIRYSKPGDKWYEVMDYTKDKLEEIGIRINYGENDLSRSETKPTKIGLRIKGNGLTLLLFELYALRYPIVGIGAWTRFTDHIIDFLNKDGLEVRFDDKKEDLLIGTGTDDNQSMKYLTNNLGAF